MAYGTRQQLTITVHAWDGEIWDFSPNRQSFRFGTIAPGGDEVASWTYGARRPYHLPPLASHVEISDGAGVIWIGRTGKPKLALVYGQADITITAYGYSHAAGDERYRRAISFPAGSAIETAIGRVLADLCPELSSNLGAVAATGRSLTAETRDFKGQTAAQIWSELCSYGDSNDDPLDWFVDNGGSGGWPRLTVRTRPSVAAYTTTLAGGVTGTEEWDLNDLETRISLEWAGDDGEAQTTTVEGVSPVRSGLTGRLVVRDKWVPASDAVADVADAANLAQAMLTKFGVIRFSGNQLTIPENTLILDGSANPLPSWRVRAGQLIALTDHTTADGLLSDTRYIVQTNYDADDGSQTLTMGDLHGAIRKIKRAMQDGSTIPEAANGPGSGSHHPSGGGGGGGGIHINRDQHIKKVSLTLPSGPGNGTKSADSKHVHGEIRHWGAAFGDGQTALVASVASPKLMTGHAPDDAVATGLRLAVTPSGAGNVSWAVLVNGNSLQSISGGNGTLSSFADVPIAKGDALQFAYYGAVSGGTPTQVTCELVVGKGE